jgi:hypothetical protein
VPSRRNGRFASVPSIVSRIIDPPPQLVLTKSKYYGAIGSVAGAAISRVMGDILALPDITEVESHRLAEMCRILNSLEGLFVEDHEQASILCSALAIVSQGRMTAIVHRCICSRLAEILVPHGATR